jgi:hypothetical protein
MAVRRAHTACNVVEVRFTFRIPKETPFLATTNILVFIVALVVVPKRIADASSVGFWLQTVHTGVSVTGLACLPADRAHSVETILAFGVAEKTSLFEAISTSVDGLTNTSTIGIFPAWSGSDADGGG